MLPKMNRVFFLGICMCGTLSLRAQELRLELVRTLESRGLPYGVGQLHRVPDGALGLTHAAFGLSDQTVLLAYTPCIVRLVQFLPQETAGVLMKTETRAEVTALALGAGEAVACAGFADGDVQIWNGATGDRLARTLRAGIVRCVALSPSSHAAAGGCEDGTVFVLFKDGKVQELSKLEHSVVSIEYSPDGKHIGFLDGAGKGHIADAESGGESTGFSDVEAKLISFTWSPDSKRIATCDSDGTLRIYNADSGELKFSMQRVEKRPMNRLVFGKGNEFLLGSAPDGAIVKYDLTSWDTTVNQVVEGSILALHRERVVVRKPDDPKRADAWLPERVRRTDEGKVELVRYSNDGSQVMALHFPRTLHLWNAQTGEMARRWDFGDARQVRPRFLDDGRILALVKTANRLRLYELPEEKLLLDAEVDVWAACRADFTSTHLAYATEKSIAVREIATGKLTGNWEQPVGFVGVFFTPDGKNLVVYTGQDWRVWDAVTGVEIHKSSQHLGWTERPRFSADGFRLIGSRGDTMHLADMFGASDSLLIKGSCACFSSDGALIAAGEEHQIQLFDAQTLRRLTPLATASGVTAIDFSPVGSDIVAGFDSGALHIWRLDSKLRRHPPVPVQQLGRSWGRLMSERPSIAGEAAAELESAGDETVKFLSSKLLQTDDTSAARALEALAESKPDSHDISFNELEYLGIPALPALRKALANESSDTLRKRFNGLIDSLERRVAPTPATARRIRALGILERLRSPGAIDALRQVAKDSPSEREREDAAAALRRIAQRKP